MEYSADLKAFNQLFADYQGRFIRFANMYVRDMAVAEDFTIEALMQYWENRNTLKADSNVPAYILYSPLLSYLLSSNTNASTTCNIYKSGKMPANT